MTIPEIARLANVSTATVWRVLNRPKSMIQRSRYSLAVGGSESIVGSMSSLEATVRVEIADL